MMAPQLTPVARPLLITGAQGTLGRAFRRVCEVRNLHYVALSRHELDIADPVAVELALAAHQPWAVVNAAGYVRVDEAERDPAQCYRANTTGPKVLAQACAHRGVQLLTFSSDLVFDGQQSVPYTEDDTKGPLNVYGRSKSLAERDVLTAMPGALVVRTSAFFGPWDEYNFVHFALQALRGGRTFEAAADLQVSPTYVPDLVNTALDLLIDEEHGIWHVANRGAYTWARLAQLAAEAAGLDTALVQPQPAAAFGWPAPRPAFSALSSSRGIVLPSVEDGLGRYMHDVHLGAVSHCALKGEAVEA
ncbi:SDR family oxidoreductase [Hymenobacter sp. 15J16-1T3B]|uniref:SDR family oxidoreductase n=1 Tax=Hymenobacter sp. 15J16-1T3B TaxID=2886941 RepID=UPI001D10C62F|nr:SDR family oxidoreductase [Hymenobacter sp. 15J16-1T3B]MCC3157689.1 SDR family oxidoreductase [Hymenobacter sp. 15J16-1T3B]